ncbi:MAG: VOC family protein [Acidimicrobiia bacterium]
MLPAIPPAKTAQVQRFLHVNLNCTNLERSKEIYTSLFGMRQIMYTESTDGDASAMGIDIPSSSRVSFLYDHRGARRSPSLELVHWTAPIVFPKGYERPNHIGMQSVAYTVPALDTIVAGVNGFGLSLGSITGDGVNATLFRDPDGVTVEVYEDSSVEKATGLHARLTVADLDRSRAWYEAIGFEADGAAVERQWNWAIPGGDTISARVKTQRVVMPFDPSYGLELTQWIDPVSEGTPNLGASDQGLYRMALGVENSRDAATALQAAGWPHANDPARFVLEGTPLPDLWISFTRDADGITVELVERPIESYK